MGSLIATVLARAHGFLVEPAPPVGRTGAAVIETCEAVQVVVTGLSRGSGATTVAAGLAQALVVPGMRSGHLVSLRPCHGAARRRAAAVAMWELPPALQDPGEIADYGATLARLAGGGGTAAVVWDVRADDAARAVRVMEACDTVVCVAEGSAEPALCALVRDMIAERYGSVLLVANRVRDRKRWAGRSSVAVPESRLGGLLIARGRAPGGAVGEALARIAALVEERA
jgi:hypothetical protein